MTRVGTWSGQDGFSKVPSQRSESGTEPGERLFEKAFGSLLRSSVLGLMLLLWVLAMTTLVVNIRLYLRDGYPLGWASIIAGPLLSIPLFVAARVRFRPTWERRYHPWIAVGLAVGVLCVAALVDWAVGPA